MFAPPAPVDDRAVHIFIDLDQLQPPRGTLRAPPSRGVAFDGWLELLGSLSDLLDGHGPGQVTAGVDGELGQDMG
jgi:hypothetical protein